MTKDFWKGYHVIMFFLSLIKCLNNPENWISLENFQLEAIQAQKRLI